MQDSHIPTGPNIAISHYLRVGRVCAESDESHCGLVATTELSQFQLQGAACPRQPPSSMTSPSTSVAPCASYKRDLLVCGHVQEKSFSPLVSPCKNTAHYGNHLVSGEGTARPMQLWEGLYLLHLLRKGCTASACSGVVALYNAYNKGRDSYVCSLASLPA